MEYTISKDTIYPLVKQEVSRLAAADYADDGSSLYDGLTIYMRDKDIVYRLIDDAFSAISARLADVCILSSGRLAISVPDMDPASVQNVTREITRFASMSAVADWCRDKIVDKAELYAQRAASTLEKIVTLVLTRKMPTR